MGRSRWRGRGNTVWMDGSRIEGGGGVGSGSGVDAESPPATAMEPTDNPRAMRPGRAFRPPYYSRECHHWGGGRYRRSEIGRAHV